MIRDAYEQVAPSYNELIDHKPHNAYYDRPNTLALLPKLKGKAVLDAACGPGKYAEIIHAQGGTVTGFDLSPKMVEYARERNPAQGHFFVHDMTEPLTMLADASFDVVLCALALHYLEDWNFTIREFQRVLKPGGALVISIGHPFFDYNYFKSDQYFAVEQVKATWGGFGQAIEVHSYRFPLDKCVAPLLNNGFWLDQLVEPRPTAEFEQMDPVRFKRLHKFPSFLCIRAVKKS